MDNFILWSISNNIQTQELSFFATSVQAQRIHLGTSSMLNEMLEDLEIKKVEFSKWSINHFATNYLMDDSVSESWNAVWQDTCEITLILEGAIEAEFGRSQLVRTYATDESWEGSSFEAPIPCVIVADFYDRKSVEKAKHVLSLVSSLREDANLLEELQANLPEVPYEQIERLRIAYSRSNDFGVDKSSHLSFRQRASHPYQLVLSLGKFDDVFFSDGAKFAEMVQDIIYELDGTTTWNDLTDTYVQN